jgi:hypothetical protein
LLLLPIRAGCQEHPPYPNQEQEGEKLPLSAKKLKKKTAFFDTYEHFADNIWMSGLKVIRHCGLCSTFMIHKNGFTARHIFPALTLILKKDRLFVIRPSSRMSSAFWRTQFS